VILATLTMRDGEWILLPSTGTVLTISDDVEVWAVVDALVRTSI